jgi:hypothetical protein
MTLTTRNITSDTVTNNGGDRVPRPKGPKTVQASFRLELGMASRLDRHVERMAKLASQVTFTRTDAIRSLLDEALQKHEADEKKRR